MNTELETLRPQNDLQTRAVLATFVVGALAWTAFLSPLLGLFVFGIIAAVAIIIGTVMALSQAQRGRHLRSLRIVYPVLLEQAEPSAWHAPLQPLRFEFVGDEHAVAQTIFDALLDCGMVTRETRINYRVADPNPTSHVAVSVDLSHADGRTTCRVGTAPDTPYLGSRACVAFPLAVADTIRSLGGRLIREGEASNRHSAHEQEPLGSPPDISGW